MVISMTKMAIIKLLMELPRQLELRRKEREKHRNESKLTF
jgi:hypothetical protein